MQVNSTGHSQIEKIIARAEEILSSANKTNFSLLASNITSTCDRERDAQEQSLRSTVTESHIEKDYVNSGATMSDFFFVSSLAHIYEFVIIIKIYILLK